MLPPTARILAVEELAAGKRLLRVEHEVSRMLVHIKDAYTGVGRLAQLRLVPSEPQQLVGDDEVQQPEARVFTLKPASPPVAFELLERSVYKLRGDISAGQTKVALIWSLPEAGMSTSPGSDCAARTVGAPI